MDKEQEQESILFILGEAFSDQMQGISFARGGPAFDSIETASLNFTEQPDLRQSYKQSRIGIPQGFQDGGDVETSPYVPPVYSPLDGGDSDAAGGGIDTGTNTVAGTIAALGVLGIALSNANLSVMAGKLGKSIVTGVTPTPNVAPLSMQIAAMEDSTVPSDVQSSEDALADIEAAEAEFGKGTSSVFAGAPASGSGTTGAIGGTVGSAYGNLGEQSDDTGPAGTAVGLGKGDSGHGSGGAQANTGNISTENTAAADAVSMDVSAGPSAGSGDVSGSSGDSGTGEFGGDAWKHGGQIKGYREGDLIEDDQADTQLDDLGLGPIGIVDDPDGTTGVADDLDLDLPHESYVINTEGTNETGKVSINKMIKEAIDMAIADGIDLPNEIKTAEKVPIKISKGETAIPYPLPNYIGLSKLAKINARGLRIREQREKEEAPVQMAAAPTAQEDLLAQVQQPIA